MSVSNDNIQLLQTCSGDRCKADRVVQLYGWDRYDTETLVSNTKWTDENVEPPLPAMEIFTCCNCSLLLQFYHRCFHFKYHLLKKCEDRVSESKVTFTIEYFQLEIIGTRYPDQSPEKIVEMSKKSRSWTIKLISEYVDLWKRIQSFSTLSSNSGVL